MIKVYKEMNLTDINWSRGAQIVYDLFTEDEIEKLQELLEDSYPDGIEATELDDLFEHEPEQLIDLLGISDSYETFYNKRTRDYEYQDQDRYCQRIVGQEDDILYSSDDLDDVIASAVADYEWGDSNSDDIEIYDQEERKVVWSTENDEDYHKESDEEDEGNE